MSLNLIKNNFYEGYFFVYHFLFPFLWTPCLPPHFSRMVSYSFLPKFHQHFRKNLIHPKKLSENWGKGGYCRTVGDLKLGLSRIFNVESGISHFLPDIACLMVKFSCSDFSNISKAGEKLELEKYISYCTCSRAITITRHCPISITQSNLWTPCKVGDINLFSGIDQALKTIIRTL